MQVPSLEGKFSCQTLWISDVHLGSVHCKAEALLALLDRVDCKTLYLVGDIVDVWAMRRRVHWPESHSKVLRKVLKISRGLTEVVYIPGNHDHNFREFCNSDFGNVRIRQQAVHTTRQGRRLLVIHGDELDFAVRYSWLTRFIGDAGYELLMWCSQQIDRLRERLNKPYWSLARWVKSNVAEADRAIAAYRHAAINLAKDRGVDGIVCGHLHSPEILEFGDIVYCNDGDWVENCSALVEDFQGNLRLIRGISHPKNPLELIFAEAV